MHPSDGLEWHRFSAQFVASGPTTNITFSNGGASNNYNNSLDNVATLRRHPMWDDGLRRLAVLQRPTSELATPRHARRKRASGSNRFFQAPVWQTLPPAGGAPAAEAEVFDLRFVSTVIRTGSLPFLKRVA